MSDKPPQPPFFDRAWMQAFTSNALGSAVGTGLVALAIVGFGAAVGVIQAPGGIVRVIILFFAAIMGVFPIVAGIVNLQPKVRQQRGHGVGYCLMLIATGIVVGSSLVSLAVSYDPPYCQHQPAACTGGAGGGEG